MRIPRFTFSLLLALIAAAAGCSPGLTGDVAGELKQWHKVTLTFDGPQASETDVAPNPFTDYRMRVTFTHESGSPSYAVPGYFAADGAAAETSASEGNKWRAHISPDKTGAWSYRVSFVQGENAAIDPGAAAESVSPDGASGEFVIGPSDKQAPDFRATGKLNYAGKHHLQFAGTGGYFLKAGADAPETLLGYADFDGTSTRNVPLKTWEAHVKDWSEGDPTWQAGKGKGLIGALNYLASEELNSFSFLTYNAGGDGDNVWPFVERDGKMHYDVSKLDQWQIVFDHSQSLGLHMNVKLQETENDDQRYDHREPRDIPEALDLGALGPERKLYLREMIARFGYEPGLNWNVGEENSQTHEEQLEQAEYIAENDAFDHPIVFHTYPEFEEQEITYVPMLGPDKPMTGVALQTMWDTVHQHTLHWVSESAKAGKPWVVANDEQGHALLGVPPDPGYEDWDGKDKQGETVHTIDDIRTHTLWGNLMAGGAGVEYYFGYDLPQNDMFGEDFRSRDLSWDYCRFALAFFREIPFWEMSNANALVGNSKNDNSKYALAKPGEMYLVYLPEGGTTTIDLREAEGEFSVAWFNPRTGGGLLTGSVATVSGGSRPSVGNAPADPDDDWAVLLRRQ